MAAREPSIALVGGAGALTTEALTWMLTKSGNLVVGTYAEFAELSQALRDDRLHVEVVVVHGADAAACTEAVAAIRRSHPDVKLLLLCDSVSPAVVSCAIDARVEGVALQSDAAEDVVQALQHVLDGRSVMPAGWHAVSLRGQAGAATLSARQREVLELAAAGLSNREIAEQLFVSLNTVKFHLRSIYSKLDVHNRVQAVHAVCPEAAVLTG
jgi:DNA-binding NarL/FixJ family response regulator